ncbi:MAG: DUF554 family protein [Alkalibacterium sp.]|nr:DUF554 family protein [Alkalibacterium sp.]
MKCIQSGQTNHHLGNRLENRFPAKEGASSLSKAFVMSSLIMAVGAMSIVGPLESGLTGTHAILLTKSVMDGLHQFSILASSMGVGVRVLREYLFSLYQGAIALLASGLDAVLTEPMINDIDAVQRLLYSGFGLQYA